MGAEDHGGFGPPIAGGRPDLHRRAIKVAFVTACTGMAVVLVLGTVNLALLWRGVETLERIPVVTRTDIPLATDAPPSFEPVDADPVLERTTILLVGSDSREGLSDADLAAIGTTDHGSDLTDTIMLLQLDPAADAARMLSFPRDLWVEHCNGRPGRINTAFATGEAVLGQGMGPSCLVTTVETMTGIGIDHYVRVDFAGFVEAVDAAGGVTFHVDEPLHDIDAGLDLEAGCHTFDGVTAIQFVRARNLDSDLGRVARQQRFAIELVDEIASVGTLTNPVRLQRLVTSISGSLQTDEAFGTAQLVDLASSLRGLSAAGLDTATVPVADQRIADQDVLIPIAGGVDAVYAPFRGTEAVDFGIAPADDDAADASADDGGAEDDPGFVGARRSDTAC